MRRAERAVAIAVVLAAHLLLLWAWRFIAQPPARGGASAEPKPVMLRLIDEPAPREEPRRTAPPATNERAATAPAPAAPPTTRREPALATITVPAAIDASASAAAPDTPPLDLAVPRAATASRRTMQEQMRDDPRANSPRPSVESRVAAVAGTREWTEERMDATRTRFRKDGRCLEVHVARNAQIDPWNQNHSPTPKVVKPEC